MRRSRLSLPSCKSERGSEQGKDRNQKRKGSDGQRENAEGDLTNLANKSQPSWRLSPSHTDHASPACAIPWQTNTTTPGKRDSQMSPNSSRRYSPWSQPSRKRPLPASSLDAVIDLTDNDGPDKSEGDLSTSTMNRRPTAPAPRSPPPRLGLDGTPSMRTPVAQTATQPLSLVPSTVSPKLVTKSRKEDSVSGPAKRGATDVPVTHESATVEAPAMILMPPTITDTSIDAQMMSAVLPPPTKPPWGTSLQHDDEKFEHDRPKSIYLRHFEDALETVMHTRTGYASLFTPEEHEAAQRFRRLSRASKHLYVRLFQRKGPWFRADGMMVYDEVSSLTPLWLRRLRAVETAAATVHAESAADASTAEGNDGNPENVVDHGHAREPEARTVTFASSPFAPTREDEKSDELSDTEEHCKQAYKKISSEEQEAGRTEQNDVNFSRRELTILHGEIQEALHELVEAGFLNPLPDNVWRAEGPGLEAAMASVGCCLRSSEIKTLLKRTAGGGIKASTRPHSSRKSKSRGRPSSGGDDLGGDRKTASDVVKRDGDSIGGIENSASAADVGGATGRCGMIAELRQKLTGQQTLWGAKLPLVKEIESLVSSSVERLGVDVVQARRRSLCLGTRDTDRDAGSLVGDSDSSQHGKRRLHLLVLMADGPRLVFKRTLRLLYLTCDTSALSSGRVGAASVRDAGAAGAISAWSPGLSAAFGKSRYASYTCDVRTRVFNGREDFLCWEAAVELRCALDAMMESLPRGWAEALKAAAESEEDDDEDEQAEAELLVVDGGGVEEAIARHERKDGLFGSAEVEAANIDTEETGLSVSGGLEEFIAQFLSPEEEALLIAGEGQTAVAAGVASPAVSLALVCARCLHAHLGTQPRTFASRGRSSIAETGNSTVTEHAEYRAVEEENLLVFLQDACREQGDGACRDQRRSPEKSLDKVGSSAAAFAPGTNIKACTPLAYRSNGDNDCEDGIRGSCSGASALGQSEVSRPGDSDSSQGNQTLGARSRCSSCPVVEQTSITHEHEYLVEEASRGLGDDNIVTDRKVSLQDTKVDEVPEFLLQLDAGWVLASAIWEGVVLLERARDYDRAVELLAQLLATRYTPHRRGRWWNRLSLDLAHAGRLRCALWASEEGVRDSRVRGGDRLALEKRTAMLTVRIANQTAKAARTLSRTSTTSSSALRSSHNGAAAAATSTLQPRERAPCSLEGQDVKLPSAAGAGVVVIDVEDDDENVFQDPTVERDKRRKNKRRRRERVGGSAVVSTKNRPDIVREAARATTSSTDDEGALCEAAHPDRVNDVGKAERLKNYGEAPTCCERSDNVSALSMAEEDFRSRGSLNGIASGDDPECDTDRVGFSSNTGVDGRNSDVKVESGLGEALALRSDDFAELPEVPDILRDESIAAVVLAATMATAVTTTKVEAACSEQAEGGKQCGIGVFGVPEITITGRRLNREVGMKNRFVGYGDGAACTVESLVLQHFSQQDEGGWAGWHCEGSSLRGLWALLMWDVLFMDLPDVFQTQFQDAPLDLDFCPLFYLNRRDAIDARLKEIRAAPPSVLAALVAKAWDTNRSTVCRGLRWDRTSVRYLQAVAAGLGGKAMAATLAALCLNHKHFGGGLPDLLLMRAVQTTRSDALNSVDRDPAAVTAAIAARGERETSTPAKFVSWLGVDSGAFDETKVFNGEMVSGDRTPVGPSSGSNPSGKRSQASPPRSPPPFEAADLEGLRVEAWLLEVKGPSDRLSDRQTAWLRILQQGGASVGVCHVSEGKGGSHVSAKDTTDGGDSNYTVRI